MQPSNVPTSQDSYEVITLMVMYLKGELSRQHAQKVENLIKNCEACQDLFEEVSFFFDDDATFLFEVTHQEEIEGLRNQFRQFVATQHGDKSHVSNFSSVESLSEELLNKDCFC